MENVVFDRDKWCMALFDRKMAFQRKIMVFDWTNGVF